MAIVAAVFPDFVSEKIPNLTFDSAPSLDAELGLGVQVIIGNDDAVTRLLGPSGIRWRKL